MDKKEFEKHVRTCLVNALAASYERLDSLMRSGALDVDSYEDFVEPKAVAASLLEQESKQLEPLAGGEQMKRFKSTKKNVGYF